MLYLAFLLILVVLLLYIWSHHTHCVPVGLSTKTERILYLLFLIQEKSPQDYEMICKYVGEIDYKPGGGSFARQDRIRISSDFVLKSGTLDEEIFRASVIVHEGCHAMMIGIMGGHSGMTEQEVERPCVRMQYLFMYRANYYKSYQDMQLGLSQESYGKERLHYTPGIPSALKPYWEDRIYRYSGNIEPYCGETVITAEKINKGGEFDLRITNSGNTTVHCGFLDLQVDGMEYPLDCSELKPEESYTTGKNFRIGSEQKVSLDIPGCDGVVSIM